MNLASLELFVLEQIIDETKLFNVFFSNDKGECYFFSMILFYESDSQTISHLFAKFDTSFKLAPDIAIITESNDYTVYSQSNVRFEEVKRSLTVDDIQAIYELFSFISFNYFSENLGIN